jgi:hypothetical protein
MKYSFECLVNILNNHTNCDSITSSSTQTVVGVPMIGHDMFHQVANNLIAKAIEQDPEIISDLELFVIDLDNPAGFNYNGERLAMVAQDYVKAFSINYNNGNKILKANRLSVPTYNNIDKLASLLSFDIKSSFSLGRHGFSHNYQDLLFEEFLKPNILLSLAYELIEYKTSSVITLFNRFMHSYNEHYGDEDKLVYHLQRFTRGSINAIQFLKLLNIEADENNYNTLVARYLVNQITFYASKSEVYKDIKEDLRLYTFYMDIGEDIFSLKQDIVNYYTNGSQSKSLKILELEFIRASGMSWKTYLNGSRFIAELFDSIYLQDFSVKDIVITDDEIIIQTNDSISLLESDMIKYTCCCLTLNSYKIEDFVARTGVHEDSKKLKAQYTAIVSPLTEQIKELIEEYDNGTTSVEEYERYSVKLDLLTTSLKKLRLEDKTMLITDQLIKYYGYCDL